MGECGGKDFFHILPHLPHLPHPPLTPCPMPIILLFLSVSPTIQLHAVQILDCVFKLIQQKVYPRNLIHYYLIEYLEVLSVRLLDFLEILGVVFEEC